METLRLENQRLKARLTEIAERKAQSSTSSCSSGSDAWARRQTGEDCVDNEDDSMSGSGEDVPSPQDYYGYRSSSPLKGVSTTIGKEKFGKDPLVLAGFSMDNIGSSNSFSWNEGQSSFNKSSGTLRVEGSKSSLSLSKSSAIPPSPDSVVYLHAAASSSSRSSSENSDSCEEKATSDDEEHTRSRNRRQTRSGSGRRDSSLEPVMEQIVRAVLEDKHASLSTPNCYKVLYKYALAQVEIQRKESEVKLARLKIVKMQRLADLQARLSLATASLPSSDLKAAVANDAPSTCCPPEESSQGQCDTDSRTRAGETGSSSALGPNANVPQHQSVLPIENAGEAPMTKPQATTAYNPQGLSVSTDPFGSLLHELIWAIAFTFCLINNLHGPGAKMYKNLKDAGSPQKAAQAPRAAQTKDSADAKRQHSRR
jgi:hypothetical protein